MYSPFLDQMPQSQNIMWDSQSLNFVNQAKIQFYICDQKEYIIYHACMSTCFFSFCKTQYKRQYIALQTGKKIKKKLQHMFTENV